MDASLHMALSVGVPTLTVLIGILINKSRQNDPRAHGDTRFDDMRRIEEVIDARLKHLEER
jgi:hypothetical protein